MNGDASKTTIIRLATPRMSGRLFALQDVDQLVLGDAVLSTPPALEAFAYYAAAERVEKVDFWGRAARLHADRALEVLSRAPAPPAITARARFEPIDLIDDAASLIESCGGRPSLFAILDPEDILERTLIRALEDAAKVVFLR